jgi:peptidoglycan/xylan/chitin deacetylase (PgdA/CDA1 family)
MAGSRVLVRDLALKTCGLITRVRGSERYPVRAIVAYHGHSPASKWDVGLEAFEMQLDFIARRFTRIVPLDELFEDAGDGSIACLTFDDGYVDNYHDTMPALERRGIRATFFLISSLLAAGAPGADGRAHVNLAQASELIAQGHEVGSHTQHHPRLTTIPIEQARVEISASKRELEGQLGAPVASFAYPGGVCTPELARMVEEAGYRSAVTTRSAHVAQDADPFTLPRISVTHSVSRAQFERSLSPAQALYDRYRRR